MDAVPIVPPLFRAPQKHDTSRATNQRHITSYGHSYAGCLQHAPNEHMLKPLMREGLRHVTGIYWDLGDPKTGYRPQ